MAWGTWRGWPLGLQISDLIPYFSQWIPAGAWRADPANSLPNIIDKPYGTSPGGDYSIYPTISLPQISQGGAQYWYFTAKPPVGWTSTQIMYILHFLVAETISLPGGYRWTLGVRRQPDVSAPNGAKTYGNLDYTCSDNNIPRYRITGYSSPITILNAVETDGLALELTRGVNPISDESDPTYIVGMELHYV